MYKVCFTPCGDQVDANTSNHSALYETLRKTFGLPVKLEKDAIPMLTAAMHAALDPTPYQQAITLIEASGSIRIEAVRVPDATTGLTGPGVATIRR